MQAAQLSSREVQVLLGPASQNLLCWGWLLRPDTELAACKADEEQQQQQLSGNHCFLLAACPVVYGTQLSVADLKVWAAGVRVQSCMYQWS